MAPMHDNLWPILFGLQGQFHELKSALEAFVVKTELDLAAMRHEMDDHKRIRSRVSKYLDRWPLFAAGCGLLAANADPNTIIDFAVKLLEAMKDVP